MEEINWIALARLFDGNQTDADRTWFAAWVSGNPERIAYAEQLRDIWVTAGAIPSRLEVHQAWTKMEAKHALLPAAPVPPKQLRASAGFFQHRGMRWAGMGTAALLALVLLRVTDISQFRSRTHSEASVSTIYSTPPGKRAVIELRDGTQVSLNVASTLEVSRDFGTHNRNVTLSGQAVFDVKHATSTPFVINTGATKTTVLGTVFGVRAYDSTVQVAVQSGKVAVSPCPVVDMKHKQSCAETGRIVLQATDIATVTPTGHVKVDRNAPNQMDRAFAWASGRLLFQNTPIREALTELERWYDVQFVVADSTLMQGHLTTTFNRAQLTEHDIQDLSVLLQAHVDRHGNTITVRPLEENR